jgi:hypothetical protein
MVDICEVHACVVAYENEWRADNCPQNYPAAYCPCPFTPPTCEGAWGCDEIATVTLEVIAYYDANGDGAINPEDIIAEDHYNMLLTCDTNNDGTIEACEMHVCIVDVENAWRAENCPDYGLAYCDCPWEHKECAGEWNCADIIYITEEFMAYVDTNNDGSVNLGDNIDAEHLELLVEYCD